MQRIDKSHEGQQWSSKMLRYFDFMSSISYMEMECHKVWGAGPRGGVAVRGTLVEDEGAHGRVGLEFLAARGVAMVEQETVGAVLHFSNHWCFKRKWG